MRRTPNSNSLAQLDIPYPVRDRVPGEVSPWGGVGRAGTSFLPVGKAARAGVCRFFSSLTVRHQHQLIDPLVGRVLKITANGGNEI